MSPQDSPLFTRVERDIPKLARRMLDRFVAEIPLYSMLPREQVEGEIASITALNLRLFFHSLRVEGPIPDDALVDIRSSAARRAEERVPLDAVLAAYHIGGRIGWEALVEAAEPDEREVLIVVAGRVLEFVQQVTGALGVAVVIEAKHMCMMMRGVEKQNSVMVTSVMLGEFRDNASTRSEFLSLIR